MLATEEREQRAAQVSAWARAIVALSKTPALSACYYEELEVTNAEGTVLHHAARENAEGFLDYFLDPTSIFPDCKLLGIQINETSEEGNTALHVAAAMGHIGIVRRLLGAGADNTLRRPDGKTAEDVAVSFGYSDVAELLRNSSPPEPAD